GARMNRERDVLFLALSSHGKPDPHLVVENGALPLDRLTPERLAAMLRESRIRWKVLVISACYAGAFIEPLRDPYTVIITAAAPDRASFGCNDRRALTYFGEAFYDEALPGAASLRKAFDDAVADIERRESAEGLKPSRPQAHFGAEVERKLAELEMARVARLRDRLGPEPAEGPTEQQRVNQSVEHELERGAPLARVPD
ncbi:MAG TPA: C13 family peptidase, partial [Steroidobacteraceae bacterium]|nr:C13 family peptidase [Steroidobacteraceae bacterium]